MVSTRSSRPFSEKKKKSRGDRQGTGEMGLWLRALTVLLSRGPGFNF